MGIFGLCSSLYLYRLAEIYYITLHYKINSPCFHGDQQFLFFSQSSSHTLLTFSVKLQCQYLSLTLSLSLSILVLSAMQKASSYIPNTQQYYIVPRWFAELLAVQLGKKLCLYLLLVLLGFYAGQTDKQAHRYSSSSSSSSIVQQTRAETSQQSKGHSKKSNKS